MDIDLCAPQVDALSPDMTRLLRYAVTDQRGHLHMLRIRDMSKRHSDPATLGLIAMGYAKWERWYDAVITEAGRIAIGAPPVMGDERWAEQMKVIRDRRAAERADRDAEYEASDHSQCFTNRPPPEPPPEAVLARLRRPKTFNKIRRRNVGAS